jgi:hypothetical protein
VRHTGWRAGGACLVAVSLFAASCGGDSGELAELKDQAVALEGATAISPRVDVQSLVEKVATRGDRPALGRALVPASWDVYDYTRSEGSGSMAWWLNPSDQEEVVYTSQGVSKGVWFEADGIEGSITPNAPEGSLIEEISPTVFTYQHLDGDTVRSGVWRATLPVKGEEVCCFYHAWIVIRGPNPQVAAAFIEHQLSQVP